MEPDCFEFVLMDNMGMSGWSLVDTFEPSGTGGSVELLVEVFELPGAGIEVEGERDAKSFDFICILLGVAGGGITMAPSSKCRESSRT